MPVFLVCDGQVIADSEGRAKCLSSDGLSLGSWITYPSDTITNTGLDQNDFDLLWGACVLFLVTGFGIRELRKLFQTNHGRHDS